MLRHKPSQSDLLFITLNKSEALFSPSTRYRDLALGPSLFHWESQSTTTAASLASATFVAPKLIGMGNWGGFDEGRTDCRD